MKVTAIETIRLEAFPNLESDPISLDTELA